jgi:hypothetical protein
MSKKIILTIMLTAATGMLVVQPDSSALNDTAYLECENGTVARGDSEDTVRNKCGNPQKVSQQDIDSPIIWFYNFGPTQFVYYLTFTNGVVERIQIGGYGD